MSYNDDSREVPPYGLEPARVVPVAPDVRPRSDSDALRAVEPPPSTVPVEQNVEAISPEQSWRTLVGTQRTGRAPMFVSGEARDAGHVAEWSSSVEAHGREPGLAVGGQDLAAAGGEMAAAPLMPTDAPADAAVHRQSSISLSRVGEELFAWLKTLASAAVYATLIVTFGFQVARVEGQSMAPTLADQDRLIVNKLAYRLGQPQVGDIVMLYYPLNPEKSFVKRVIAEEGDQIRIVDGRVYRNDVQINDDYVPEHFRSHDDWGPEVVPQGYYFVMGDHRNNSSDSRHWRFVPKKYIIGKVQLRWWPLPEARIF